MLSIEYIKQQLRAQKLLEERYKKIAAIYEKYGGRAIPINDSVEVEIPKENIEAAMKELEGINEN